MTGEWEAMAWRQRSVPAWVPHDLATRSFEFSEPTIRAAEQSTAALRDSDVALPANWEPLARLLLRTEGIASSSIEGVHAPLVDVAVAEFGDASASAGWIADNLAAVADAVVHPVELTVEVLHRWHHRLMRHSPLDPAMIGAFRTDPGWIGGTSPLDAVFVPSPPDHIPQLMNQLVVWANSDHSDPVTQAALLHAQFETIHPYGDGNGRLGRILIGWLLRRRGVVARLPPPISVLIARDPGGYISGLHLFREGPVDPWVRWFADVAHASARQSNKMIEEVGNLVERWLAELDDLRSDAAAKRIVPLLPESPVLNATVVAARLGVSERAARSALQTLTERGVLSPVEVAQPADTRGRPAAHFGALKLLDAAAGWAR